MKAPNLWHALRRALSVLLTLALVGAARAQVTKITLTASDSAEGDFFGASVSLEGDRALVGAAGSEFVAQVRRAGRFEEGRVLLVRQRQGLFEQAVELLPSIRHHRVGLAI